MPTWFVLVAPWLLVTALPLLAFALAPTTGRRRADAQAVPATHVAERDAPVRAPRALVTRMERNLALAGLAGTWPLVRLVLWKNVLGVGALVLGVLWVLAVPSVVVGLIALVVIGTAYMAPDAIVVGRARERQALIRKELADTLDQITISIEAGLSLESAVGRAGQHGTGPLAQEFTRTVQDMRVGLSRREAYTALAERTTVVDLKRFARAIMQADAYGVSVGQIVRSQARELRLKRRQRAEEAAMKIPVKVLFPLMVCILPVLFIVVLAPAALSLLRIL